MQIKTLRNQLKKLFLTLDGRGNFWTDGDRDYIPTLEEVLDICPHLEDLSFSFGVKRVDISQDRLADEKIYGQLSRLNVETYMTKRAFTYLWTRCPNLDTLKVESLSMTSAFPQQNAPAFVPFDTNEVDRLIRTNPMINLRELDVMLPVKDIKTAEVNYKS